MRKNIIFLLLVLLVGTGCIKKCEENTENERIIKIEQIISDSEFYNKNVLMATTNAVRDGVYIKNGNYLKYYTFEGIKILSFKEKLNLLDKMDLTPDFSTVVIGNMAKTFNNYLSLEDLQKRGENATEKIGLYSTVYDVEKSRYCFAVGSGIAKPVIGTGGNYSTIQAVTISCITKGVKIKYTVDGTEPITNSTEYTTQLTVSNSKVIKAKAFSSDGLIGSETAVAVYTISTELTDEFIYGGKVYKGKIDAGSEEPKEIEDTGLTITEPTVKNFSCDGYFNLKGSYSGTGADKYVKMTIKNDTTENSTSYYLSGNFDRKIWLRYGAGTYTIKIYPIRLEKEVTVNEPYDGEILSYSIDIAVFYRFKVTNIRDEDGRFLYPSDNIQSDSPLIYSTAKKELEVAGMLNGSVKEKAKVLHDYTAKQLEYDYSSLVLTQMRKQDAITCLNSGLGVCEGYTSLYNALLRSQGIQAKAILGNNKGHAWSNVLGEDGVWYMVDTTWDDQKMIINNEPPIPYIMDKYFWLLGNTGVNNDHSWDSDREYRNIIKYQPSFFMTEKEGRY